MSVEINKDEHRPLLVNDIRVLTSELNERIKEAARQGLKVELTVTSVLEIQPQAVLCPVLAVRVLAEVH
jgi:hypothetical protein